jgi:signal transduction histidine kinase
MIEDQTILLEKLNLAISLYFGKGIEQDRTKAVEWLKKAGRKGKYKLPFMPSVLKRGESDDAVKARARIILAIHNYYKYDRKNPNHIPTLYHCFKDIIYHGYGLDAVGHLWLAYICTIRIDRIERDEELYKSADCFCLDKDGYDYSTIGIIDFFFPDEIICFLESNKTSAAKVILAFYYKYKNKENESINLFSKAANENDIIADYELGEYYLSKYHKEKELNHIKEASKYFNKVEQSSQIFSDYENYTRDSLIPLAKDKIKEIDGIKYENNLQEKNKQLELEIQEKEAAQKQVEEKNKELNNLIAMFAHNFLGTLQCIRSNAEHDNNAKIHLKTVKMMSGALTAFSIISADDDKLIEQLKQDNTGETNLLQNLANNLALAISQLLSKTNKDKIINLYLNYLRKTNQIETDTISEELRENRDYRKKWQALQHQWEDEFNALFSENVELCSLQTWLADNFFPVQITGFDNNNIRFKEYGITDSIFLVVFMEILVNALKYMDVSQNQPLILTLHKQDQHYHLICENPSSQETYRGTHKGMDFLKSIARKLNAQFITESTEQQFKTTFIIPAELLD